MDAPEGRHLSKVAAAAALLLLLAGASGLGWRFEIESRGWASLSWTSYFHLAFPVAMAAFVLWALAVCRFVHALSPGRLCALAAALAAIGTAGFFVIPRALLAAYGGWGGGLLSVELAANPMLVFELPDFFGRPGGHQIELLLRDLAFWTVWLSPTVAIWISLRATGVRSRIWSVPLSGLVQFWAWPVSCGALAILEHKGGSDPAHALKSGFVVPFLVVAVGLPFLAAPLPAPPSR